MSSLETGFNKQVHPLKPDVVCQTSFNISTMVRAALVSQGSKHIANLATDKELHATRFNIEIISNQHKLQQVVLHSQGWKQGHM